MASRNELMAQIGRLEAEKRRLEVAVEESFLRNDILDVEVAKLKEGYLKLEAEINKERESKRELIFWVFCMVACAVPAVLDYVGGFATEVSNHSPGFILLIAVVMGLRYLAHQVLP